MARYLKETGWFNEEVQDAIKQKGEAKKRWEKTQIKENQMDH